MGKDPAFLFYPGDWLGGTIGMTFEEKGAYMELLMMQFNRGHMTTHMIGQTVGQLWVTVQDKFIQDDKGLWFNVRLDLEKERRKSFVSSRNNNKSGKNQFQTKPEKVGHMTSHMENENEDVNEDVNKNEGEDFENTFLKAFDEITCASYGLAFKGIDLGAELQKFRIKCDNDRGKYYGRDVGGLRTAFQYQLQNLRKNGKQTSTGEQRAVELANYFAAKGNQ